jgi:Peptidase family M1 domain
MEYPMMCNNSSQRDTVFSRFVAEHEIAHMYMPFYMGTNETRYGFMDEGWATALEYLIGIDDLGIERADQLFKMFRVNGWINDASQSQDIPIITPTNDLNGAAMGNNEYGKAALGYLAVKDLLGDEEFKLCLQTYMDRWHGKHPTPWDFFYTFNDVSEKNLNWFWSSWFFTNNYIDMVIKDPVKTKAGYTLTLDNIGGMPAPVDIVVNYDDNTSEKLHQSPAIWQKNPKQAAINVKTAKKISSVSLDGGIFMDADVSNNSWKAK